MHKFSIALLAAALALPASASTPITLDQAMADPDWIGTPVENAWWGLDSRTVYFKQKRAGSPLRDTWVAANGKPRLVADSELADMDSNLVVFNRERTRAAMVRNGDLFERDLKTGRLVQLTRGAATRALPQYSADGKQVQYRLGHDWYSWDRASRISAPLALPRATKDPAAAPDDDALRAMQLRLIQTLKRQKDERDALRARSEQERLADPTRAPAPIYLGDKIVIQASSLAPNGKWLLLVTAPKTVDAGRVGKMPRYVTESGYEEFDDQRTRVGRNLPAPHTLKLVELATGKVSDLAYDVLPGIGEDPLAQMRKAQKIDPLKGNRPVRVEDNGDAILWSATGDKVAVMVRAVDNKDRWIATVDTAAGTLQPVHRLSDSAWVNWSGESDFGWMPDNQTLWYLSEESGYSHLYTTHGGRARALTTGKWEATGVRWAADGSSAWFVCNRKDPATYEVCEVSAKDANVREVTAMNGGVERFALSPDERKLVVAFSSSYMPVQIATQPSHGGQATQLTDTRTKEFKAREWVQPQYVQVPSSAGGDPVWGKLYKPENMEAGKTYPIVLFVHGAGYLQNVSKRYPNYFREQMFHNLLVQKGYVVLDLDYRASKGYGAKWRTAIYRQMGHPELDDYIDGTKWLVANHQGDAKNVGIYGGSYGGFLTFMALMREPEMFKAGAALRPVTDWTTYNHEYTANILNTPDLDPEAYSKSSPIEYAQNLKGHLLISHGMVDDNVFYQDSVRIAQRLIELKKDNWEMASYPLERHAFTQPESWYDQYRRIYQLFERTLKQK